METALPVATQLRREVESLKQYLTHHLDRINDDLKKGMRSTLVKIFSRRTIAAMQQHATPALENCLSALSQQAQRTRFGKNQEILTELQSRTESIKELSDTISPEDPQLAKEIAPIRRALEQLLLSLGKPEASVEKHKSHFHLPE